MALSKVNFNSMNVTPVASKAIKFNSSNNGLETGDISGSLILLSTQTASSSATISFTSDINSTYKEYIFKFIGIHPATDNAHLKFQVNASGGSGFNETLTSTYWFAYHYESDSGQDIAYDTNADLAQSTSFQSITENIGSDNDHNACGTLRLFNPSSTTFVKHFISEFQTSAGNDYSRNDYVAGYFNITSAIDEIQFKMSSGNMDSGTIKMYGLL